MIFASLPEGAPGVLRALEPRQRCPADEEGGGELLQVVFQELLQLMGMGARATCRDVAYGIVQDACEQAG